MPSLCFVFCAPSGAADRRIWRVAAAEGVAARQINDRGVAVDDAVRCDERHAVVERAAVHTLFQLEPVSAKVRLGLEDSVQLQRSIPTADIYVAVGREATLVLASGRLPQRWQSVEDHASSVIREPRGLCTLPPGAVVVPIHLPGFIPVEHKARQAALWGNEEWYPSQRLTMRRVRALLDGTLPVAPPQDFKLFAGLNDITDLVVVAKEAGGCALDLETPRDGGSIYIGAFAVGSKAWVLDSVGAIAAAKALFDDPSIRIYGQNLVTFDLPILSAHGVRWPSGVVRDSRWMDSKLRPRMPHDLASMAAHTLSWAEPNWKPLGEAVAMTLEQRRYCAWDAWVTYFISKEQEGQFV